MATPELSDIALAGRGEPEQEQSRTRVVQGDRSHGARPGAAGGLPPRAPTGGTERQQGHAGDPPE